MTSPTRSSEPFFLVYSLALLAVVVAGFGPTFFFRDDALPSLPTMLLAHAGIVSAWFLMVPIQAVLLAGTRSDARLGLHKILGFASAAIAIAVVWSGVEVSADNFANGGKPDLISPAGLLLANLLNVTHFSICVALGVAWRTRPVEHKRFVSVAGVVILGPAAFRLTQTLGLSGFASLAIQLAFLVAMAWYDRKRLGRVHRATWIAAAMIIVLVVASLTVGSSDLWARWAKNAFLGG